MNETSRLEKTILAIQHVFAMFGATVLVPALTGLNPSVALISAGVGTLIFHSVTGGIVPVFLGSSFAFIGAIVSISGSDGAGVSNAMGAIVATGVVYIMLSVLVRSVGSELIKKLFPPVVTGPVIMVIGLSLAPIAVDMASSNWVVSSISIATIIIATCFMKGFFKLVPILMGIVVGYIAAMMMGIVDFTPLHSETPLFISPSDFTFPTFEINAILIMTPIALVSFMEHIGDITTNGAVVGKDFFKKPGLHRTLLGDGLATMFAGFIGGPVNTTYSENTGVLAVTKNYNPLIIRMAAVFAIILGVFAPIGVLLRSIPLAVMGGVSFVLFGMIASIGMRTMAHSKLDFNNSRNLIIVSMILVVGLGGVEFSFYGIELKGIGLSALVGMILNLVLHVILPDNLDND